MPFASLDDINVQLPDDKIAVDDARYDPLQLDAERVIRGYLAGHIPATAMATWSTPDNTPGLIRAIAGRLVAAFWYRVRYSEDSHDDPQFAQFKYNEAISWLQAIIAGTMVLEEVVVASVEVPDFWPDSSVEPKFTMTMNL